MTCLLSLGIAHRAGTSQLKNQAQRQREGNYGRSLPKSRTKNTEIKKEPDEGNSLDFSRYKRTSKMRIAEVVEFRDSYNETILKFK